MPEVHIFLYFFSLFDIKVICVNSYLIIVSIYFRKQFAFKLIISIIIISTTTPIIFPVSEGTG